MLDQRVSFGFLGAQLLSFINCRFLGGFLLGQAAIKSVTTQDVHLLQSPLQPLSQSVSLCCRLSPEAQGAKSTIFKFLPSSLDFGISAVHSFPGYWGRRGEGAGAWAIGKVPVLHRANNGVILLVDQIPMQ